MKPKKFKKVYVEISNICNLACDFCPEVERDKKIMGRELFEKIIGEITPLTDEVCFHLMGEPLAHPQFAEYVEICAGQGLPVNITTNGTLLNEERARALLHPIIRQVNFSLHSFEANFGEKDIGPYLNKIFAFTHQALTTRPDLYINYRLWNLAREDDHASNENILTAIEENFGVALNRQVDVAFRKNKNVAGRLYLNFDTRFDWPSLKNPLRSETGFCYGLSSHLAIHADGTVVPCCLDKEAGINLGSCADKKIATIVDGDRATRMAKGFQNRQLVEDLCRRCSFIERFDGKVRNFSSPSR